MAKKRMNPLLIVGVVISIVSLSLVMYSDKKPAYQKITQLPGIDTPREDGDTQTDTIKALQAYAREAVNKADRLHRSTQDNMDAVLENKQKVEKLERENNASKEQLKTSNDTLLEIQQQLQSLKNQLSSEKKATDITTFNDQGLPIGFGFDNESEIDIGVEVPADTTHSENTGQWYSAIDQALLEDQSENGQFSGLLPRATEVNAVETIAPLEQLQEETQSVYTLPKDATLTDAIALTALIGRIPVGGQTPDPYPVKIYVGKENLLANGHDLPEIEGMIFSGLGFGDRNLNCVSARLTSATFIFDDGTIVNHSSANEQLGYISDPAGFPCVDGKFFTTAPAFISQRVGLAALGAAGSAYAEAQEQRQVSSLTGTTTNTVTGNIGRLAIGEATQSATDEISEWLLARQQQSFDAVVVKPGEAVSIHLERTLPLDKNSLSRKLRYVENTHQTAIDLD